MEPEPAPPAPPIVVPPPPIVPTKTGLRDSIFEVSKTTGRDRSSNSNSADADPTVAAGMALTDATDQAVISLGEGRRPAVETSADGVSGGTALSAAPPRLPPPPFADPDRDTAGFTVGKVLSGRLEIVADLGGGPLGRVFKAIDRKKGSVVVVKAIAASRLPAAALSGRFAEVINLVKGLTHPNLVRVHGAGRDGDTAFVIMQHLEGLPLRRLLDVKRENGGTFTFEEAEPIVVQICQGLQFAHAVLVHGGLKPENVFVQVDSLKLIDTGFSRLFSPEDWREIQREGKGSGAYLAPEFAADGRIDKRADVYSVGAILYEMLTGRAPTGPDSPAVSSMNPSVPRAVDRVVQKAMAAAPENRYASAGELKDAVLRVLGGDILADDLEAGAGDMGTFVDLGDKPDDGPIEIEYVEAPPDPEPERKSDDATPVGAIELQEPLWEPDEIAETRASDPSGRRRPATEAIPRPGAPPPPPPSAIAPRGIAKPRNEDATATSAIARPDMSVEQLMDTGRGMGPDPGAERDGDKPSSERTSISSVSEDEAVDQSVDLGGDEQGATEAGFEPTTGSAEPIAEPPPPHGSWLDQPNELGDDDGPSGLSPRVLAPVSARPRADSDRRERPEMSLSEGSPIDLELDDRDAPPAARPPLPPSGDAPTIRRTSGAPPGEPRRPTATPAPWDSRNEQPTEQLADRPTDPRGGKPSDRPTASPPRRYEDNPGARALGSPPIQPLELTFSAVEEGPEGAPPVNRPAERPTADAPAPMVKPPVAVVVGAPRIQERPTLTGGPRPAFVARRRSPSRLPLILVFLVFAGGSTAAGTWAFMNRDRLLALMQPPVPVDVTCPEGMIGFAEGSFLQGSNKLDPDRDITEVLSTDVTVKSFCIDRYEYPNEAGEPPLTGVTFTEAVESCATQGKRLCNEVEWERACKGPAGSRYPYGDRFEAGICNVASTDTPGKPAKSGQFDKCGDASGPRDLSGNVWEMTSSPWTDDPDLRVIKGGSAKLPSWGARCAYRDSIELAAPADDIGFRCCK